MALILNNKHWINKSIIEKRENQKAAYKIQVYNNNVIDKYIEDFENDETIPKPSQATLYTNLWILNKLRVNKQYQKIINSKYASDKAFLEILMKNKANARLNTVVEAELERINKNLNYIEKILKIHELNLKEYQKIAKCGSAIANRKNIMECSVKCLDYVEVNLE